MYKKGCQTCGHARRMHGPPGPNAGYCRTYRCRCQLYATQAGKPGAHTHHFDFHPNPGWRKTHAACTVCGMAIPFHLLVIALRSVSSPTVAQGLRDEVVL